MDVLSAVKTAVSQSYSPGETVVYVLSIVNNGEAAVTDLTVTDDLGGYAFEDETVYPLAYVEGSLLYFQNGVLQPDLAPEAGPPLVVGGIAVPAGGNVTLIYETRVTAYAPLEEGGEITNTAEITGGCVPLTASATVPREGSDPELTISKSVSPEVVEGCGTLTYTFVIQNIGSGEAAAGDMVTVTDVFDPILSDITAELDGQVLTETADYTYDETTGQFATTAGRITVPAASASQNGDGTWTLTPGMAVLIVSGML